MWNWGQEAEAKPKEAKTAGGRRGGRGNENGAITIAKKPIVDRKQLLMTAKMFCTSIPLQLSVFHNIKEKIRQKKNSKEEKVEIILKFRQSTL